MYKRAFLAVQYQTENHVVNCSGMADVPWPPEQEDLDDAANCIASVHAAKWGTVLGDATIISLAWCSEVRE